jgi:hypothetical protein
MYHSSSSYNEPVPIVVQQYDVGSAFHALVGIPAPCRRSRARQQQQQSERRISSQKIIILYDGPNPNASSPVPLVYFPRLVPTLGPLLTLSGIGPSATQKICVQDVLLKRVFSVSIYFRSVRSLQVQPFLVLSSKHGAICHFLATGPEDLLTSLKSNPDQARRYWSYIRIRTKPPQLFQICRRDLHPSSKRGQNTGQYLTTLCEASSTTAGIRSE